MAGFVMLIREWWFIKLGSCGLIWVLKCWKSLNKQGFTYAVTKNARSILNLAIRLVYRSVVIFERIGDLIESANFALCYKVVSYRLRLIWFYRKHARKG